MLQNFYGHPLLATPYTNYRLLLVALYKLLALFQVQWPLWAYWNDPQHPEQFITNIPSIIIKMKYL